MTMSSKGDVPEGWLAGALALHLLGILHAHEGRYEEAEEAFLRAVEAEPGMAGSHVELGLVYACQERYAEMVEALRRAVAVGASGVRAYLGERPLGDIPPSPAADARGSAFRSGEAEGEKDVPRLVALAMAHLAAGRDGEAAKALEPMLQRRPGRRPAAVALLALCHLLRGESVEATGEGARYGARSDRG